MRKTGHLCGLLGLTVFVELAGLSASALALTPRTDRARPSPVLESRAQQSSTTPEAGAEAGRPSFAASASVSSVQVGPASLWGVSGGGGGKGHSVSYSLDWTVGQTASGAGTSSTYRVNLGFWQNFNTTCCVGRTGNINMSGIVDVSDLCALVMFLTSKGYTPPCLQSSNVNGIGIVDLADLSALVSYLTGGGYSLPNCP